MRTSYLYTGINRAINEYRYMAGGINSVKGKIVNSYKIGERLAGMNGCCKAPIIAKSIVKKTKISQNEVPSLAALVGTVTPVPFGTVIGYLTGKFLVKLKQSNILKTISSSVNNCKINK